LERMLELSDAGVKNRWIEREEKLCVVSIKVVIDREFVTSAKKIREF